MTIVERSVRLSSSAGTRLRSAAMFGSLFVIFTMFAMAIAGGEWIQVAAIIAAFGGVALMTRGLYVLSLIWMVGMPTLFVFPDRYLNALPGLTAGRLLFAAIVAAMCLNRIFRLGPGRRMHRAEVWFGVFLTIALLSMVWYLQYESFAGVKVNLAMYLQGYLLPLGAFFIARRIAWTSARLAQFLCYMTWAGMFLAVLAILQQYFGVTLFNPQHIEVINADRASGTLGSPHEFGAVVCALIILAMLQALHGRKTPAGATFYLFAAAFMAVALLLAKTRAPWLATMVALAFVFLFDKGARPLLTSTAILTGIAGIILVPFLLDSEVWRYRIAEVSPIYNRLTAYATSLNALLHNPFVGMGFTDTAFDKAKAGYISGAGSISAYWVTNVGVPHNEFLNLGLLTGVPGLTAYLVGLGHVHGALSKIRRFSRDPLVGKFAVYVNAILVSFVVNAMLIDFSLSTYFPILFYFLAGTAVRYGENHAAEMRGNVAGSISDLD